MSEATFINLGFETAGIAPGEALGWQLNFQSSAEELAGFAPIPEKPREGFEAGWLLNEDYVFAFGQTSLEPTLFDSAPTSVEDFEEEWFQNETFLFEHSGLAAAFFDIENTSKSVEDFDELWANNDNFEFTFGPSSLGTPFLDALESGWRSNQTFLFSFSTGSVIPASFDAAGTAELVEDYEELWPTIRMVTL